MEFKITFKIDAEEGTLNAYKLCHTIQEQLVKDSIVHKKKVAKVLGYKMKRGSIIQYQVDDIDIEGEKDD